MSRTRVGVGVVVLRADGRVLLAERRAEDGVLAVPGGRMEAGENVEECAVRELREETGLILRPDEVDTFACVLADGWLVAGVRAPLPPGVEPVECEPELLGGFVWAEREALPGGLYPPTAALLERL